MKVTGAHTILFVVEQDRSKQFYGRVLAREPVLDVPGMTEFQLAPDVVLGLMPRSGARRILGAHGPSEDRAAPGANCELYLRVDDPDGAVTRVLEAGGRLISPVSLRDWGDRAGYCSDLDGHVVAFASSTDE